MHFKLCSVITSVFLLHLFTLARRSSAGARSCRLCKVPGAVDIIAACEIRFANWCDTAGATAKLQDNSWNVCSIWSSADDVYLNMSTIQWIVFSQHLVRSSSSELSNFLESKASSSKSIIRRPMTNILNEAPLKSPEPSNTLLNDAFTTLS